MEKKNMKTLKYMTLAALVWCGQSAFAGGERDEYGFKIKRDQYGFKDERPAWLNLRNVYDFQNAAKLFKNIVLSLDPTNPALLAKNIDNLYNTQIGITVYLAEVRPDKVKLEREELNIFCEALSDYMNYSNLYVKIAMNDTIFAIIRSNPQIAEESRQMTTGYLKKIEAVQNKLNLEFALQPDITVTVGGTQYKLLPVTYSPKKGMFENIKSKFNR